MFDDDHIDPEFAQFLACLADTGTLATACELSEVSYSRVRTLQRKNSKFREAVEYHLELAKDRFYLKAQERALGGWMEPQFFQGQPVYAPQRDPATGRILTETVDNTLFDPAEPVHHEKNPRTVQRMLLEPSLKRVFDNKLLQKLLDGDARLQRKDSVHHQHDVAAKVGVVLMPLGPVAFTGRTLLEEPEVKVIDAVPLVDPMVQAALAALGMSPAPAAPVAPPPPPAALSWEEIVATGASQEAFEVCQDEDTGPSGHPLEKTDDGLPPLPHEPFTFEP